MKYFREHKLFVLLFAVAALLRIAPLFSYQFTYDELSGLDRTQFDSFGELLEKGVKIDAHPGLVQVFLYYMVKIFGYAEWIIKLPFILLSLGAMIFVYLTGSRHFSRETGLYAASFLAFSLVFVFYAPIARMYISGVFFATGLLYHFLSVFFSNAPPARNFFWLGLFALLSALNHHMGALFALSLLLCGVILQPKVINKKFIITCVLVLGAYAPHLPVTFYQFGLGGIGTEQGGWLEKPVWSDILHFIAVILGTGWLWIPVAALATFGLIQRQAKLPPVQWLFLSVFVLNICFVFFYSVYRAPVFQNSVLLFAGIPFLVFVSFILPGTLNGRFFTPSFFCITLLLLFQTYLKKDYFTQCVKTVFDYQFERTVHYKNKFGDRQVTPLFFDADTLMKKIYFAKYDTKFECRISSDSMISWGTRTYYPKPAARTDLKDTMVSSIRLFAGYISRLKSDYVILSSATPLYCEIVKEHFPFLIENTQTQAINFKVFGRKDAGIVPDDERFVLDPGETTESHSVKVADSIEFPFERNIGYSFGAQEGDFILVKTRIRQKSASQPAQGFESCIVFKQKGAGQPLSYNSRAAADFMPGSAFMADAYIGRFHRKIPSGAATQLSWYYWNKDHEALEAKIPEVYCIRYWPRKWNFWK